MEEKEGSLKIWWIPQVPMKPFFVEVESLQEAKKILKILAEYDLFQYKHRVKPDYCNVGGLSIFKDGEWVEWCDEETGDNIDNYKI